MGSSHALAYHELADFELVGLVSRGATSRTQLSATLGGITTFSSFKEALAATSPDVVSINTYPDTHATHAIQAIEAGCHVFVEKPLAQTTEACDRVIEAAEKHGKKVVVGYILRYHPTWQRFIAESRKLGTPLVMRINLNQQSKDEGWELHKRLMASSSPLVDCGVHYLDVMCQMTDARPVAVSGIGARLSDEIAPDMYNYGQLQILFDDGSVGWYESGWGPMISETGCSIKDVIGPRGSVSMIPRINPDERACYPSTAHLNVHPVEGDDHLINTSNEPDHGALCLLEQKFLLRAIREDVDLTNHLQHARDSLEIALAADEAIRTQSTVRLERREPAEPPALCPT
jgi:predicted dehydrogenase